MNPELEDALNKKTDDAEFVKKIYALINLIKHEDFWSNIFYLYHTPNVISHEAANTKRTNLSF